MLLYAEGRRRTTMILDSYTLIINSAVISFVMMIAMMMVWSVSREHRSALLWAAALGLNCGGLIVYTLSPLLPPWGPPFGNFFFAIAGYLLWAGLRDFRKASFLRSPVILLPVYYILGILYFLFIQTDLTARIFIASTFQISAGMLYAREALLIRRRGLAGAVASIAAAISIGHALYYAFRLISALGFEPVPTLLGPHTWQTYTFLESGIYVLATGVALMAMTVDNLYLQLRLTALSDRTTGLLSRNAVLERLTEEMAAAHSAHRPLHLMMIDLDHLDRVNETYGHKAGDAMLAAFGSLMRNEFRLEKNSGRYGGDEFALVLPGMTAAEATNLAHQIRRATEALILPLENGRVSLTVSIGLTGLQHQDQQFDTLIARADTALYRAKQTGRNRVVVL
ncbi:hypothetical protein GCM10011497_23730 [Elstera cyanobacteriorum]|uniref:diguanylate cyclase n=1 Tax=Elstera cyanobacteriorum TaxID=2022747 RepID=A0A255XKA4_9PROT|nr:GGDEF domain-containing protein [Elstera cyanobacteriorum]OYQ17322.1 hypothetical protein CHR90_15260 [Elstera cyanobacteriorum]GFZ92983.1 hypothetical protein GCM10011497_23730 [Elstera cyanobacteriorum]